MKKVLASCVVLAVIGCSGGDGGGTGGGSASTGGGSNGTGGGGGSTATGGGSGTGGGGGTGGGAAGGTVMPVPTELIGLSAGYTNTCAVLANKTAKCWGRNNAGQLGIGMMDFNDHETPAEVMGLTTVEQISVGYEHVCAVLTDRTGRCWGVNTNGQLGDNSKTQSSVPVTVTGLSNVASIHAGVSISCAVHVDGTVSCWGRGGELGDNGVTESLVPRVVPGLANVTQLSIAPNAGSTTTIHVCGVRSDGTAFCWGNGAAGAGGSGTQTTTRAPTPVVGPGDAGITDAAEITAGGTHGCMRRAAGVSCWGFSQQVGDGTINQSLVAVPVDAGTLNLVAIEAGNDQTLARTSTNSLVCWGRNGRGQCGDSAAFTPSGPIYLAPVATTTMEVSLFTLGGSHGCAYQPGPRVTWCWGATDWGALGFPTEQFVSRLSVPDFVRW